MTRYAVAHGRRSGRGGAARLGGEAVARLRAGGHEVLELECDTLEAAREACRRAVDDGVEVLVVAGGDGIVSLATDACAGTSTAVGILPAGSGNDAARSLGIPLRPAGSLRLLLEGSRRRLDTIHVEELDRHVLGSVAGALDARINHRAALLPRRLGATSYTLAALVEVARLPRTEPLRYRLVLDGEHEQIDLLVVTVANLPYFGGGLRIAPDADPSDGLLDLVVIHPVGPLSALRLLAAVRAGRHATDHPGVQIRRVRSVRLDGPGDVIAHGDGEALRGFPLTLSVAPANLEVIAPPLT